MLLVLLSKLLHLLTPTTFCKDADNNNYYELHNHTEITTCIPPSPPPNGYIIPYNSQVEGATVTFMLQTYQQIGHQSVCIYTNVTAVCSKDGQWELNADDQCFNPSGGAGEIHFFTMHAIASGSLLKTL